MLLDGGATNRTGIGELGGITEMDLSGIDFGNIYDLGPLFVMDDLTDLWLVNTVNLGSSALDALLNDLATIEGISTEGVLYMTQANFDDFGPLLAAWDEEDGHHVDFVVPGDFDSDGTCDGADFLAWQRGESRYPLSSSDLAEWQEKFGVPVSGDFDGDGDVDGVDFLYWQLNDGSESNLDLWQAAFGNVASSVTAASTGVPEPTTGLLLVLGMASLLFRRHLEAA